MINNSDAYTNIPNLIIDDENLSLKAKGLYLIIQYYSDCNHIFSKEYIMEKCKEGERSFNSAWNELKKSGYLSQYKRSGVNGFYYEYELMNNQLICMNMQQEKGYVYVMECLGFFKIGSSKTCSRLGEYTRLPETPKYHMIEYVDDMFKVEKIIHDKYGNKRKRDGECEWFDLQQSDIEEIKKIVEPFVIHNAKHTKYYYKYCGAEI